MTIYSAYKEVFPKLQAYLDHNTAQECVEELIKKIEPGKVFKLLTQAYESNWQNDEKIEALIKAALDALYTGKAAIQEKHKKRFFEIKTAYEKQVSTACTVYNSTLQLFTIPRPLFINHILNQLTQKELSNAFLSCKEFRQYRPALCNPDGRGMYMAIIQQLSYKRWVPPSHVFMENFWATLLPYAHKTTKLAVDPVMTDQDINTIVTTCPNLRVLTLTIGGKVTEKGLESLKQLTKLHRLMLICPTFNHDDVKKQIPPLLPQYYIRASDTSCSKGVPLNFEYADGTTRIIWELTKIDQVRTLEISNECTKSFPCQHQCTITLNDGRQKIITLDGDEILTLIRNLSTNKIVKGTEDFSIYNGYGTPNPEIMLSDMFS